MAARGSGAGWDTATRSPSVAVAVGRFLLAGAAVVALLAIATGLASRRAANHEAINRSKNVTWVVAHGIVDHRLSLRAFGLRPDVRRVGANPP